MRKEILIAAVLCLAAGCESNSSKPSQISESDIPNAVQAAFTAEHPYSKIDHPKTYSDSNGVKVYEIPYTRSDGTTGIAKYGASGELIVEVQKD